MGTIPKDNWILLWLLWLLQASLLTLLSRERQNLGLVYSSYKWGKSFSVLHLPSQSVCQVEVIILYLLRSNFCIFVLPAEESKWMQVQVWSPHRGISPKPRAAPQAGGAVWTHPLLLHPPSQRCHLCHQLHSSSSQGQLLGWVLHILAWLYLYL